MGWSLRLAAPLLSLLSPLALLPWKFCHAFSTPKAKKLENDHQDDYVALVEIVIVDVFCIQNQSHLAGACPPSNNGAQYMRAEGVATITACCTYNRGAHNLAGCRFAIELREGSAYPFKHRINPTEILKTSLP